jgi:hypothetical protein
MESAFRKTAEVAAKAASEPTDMATPEPAYRAPSKSADMATPEPAYRLPQTRRRGCPKPIWLPQIRIPRRRNPPNPTY